MSSSSQDDGRDLARAHARGHGVRGLVATHPVAATLAVGLLVGIVPLAAVQLATRVSGLMSLLPLLFAAPFYWRIDEVLYPVSYASGPLLFWLLGIRLFRGRSGVPAAAPTTLALIGFLDLALLVYEWLPGQAGSHADMTAWALYSALNVLGLAGLVAASVRLRQRPSFPAALAHHAALTTWLLSVGFVGRL